MIGYHIVEYEQHGEDRAEYGSNLLQNIAKQLNTKGLSNTNLKLFKQFYLAYPQISQTLSDLLRIGQTPSAQMRNPEKQQAASADLAQEKLLSPEQLISKLSFSHLVELMKIDEPIKRSYYEIETIKGVWSVRELKRHVNSLNFERSAVSK